MIHANSLSAFRTLDRHGRAEAILSIYRSSMRPLTDRQVMEHLGFTEMNQVRPRISELIDAGALVEVYDQPDHITGKSVRACTHTGTP